MASASPQCSLIVIVKTRSDNFERDLLPKKQRKFAGRLVSSIDLIKTNSPESASTQYALSSHKLPHTPPNSQHKIAGQIANISKNIVQKITSTASFICQPDSFSIDKKSHERLSQKSEKIPAHMLTTAAIVLDLEQIRPLDQLLSSLANTVDTSGKPFQIICATDAALSAGLGCINHQAASMKIPINTNDCQATIYDIQQNTDRKNCFFLALMGAMTLDKTLACHLIDSLILSDDYTYAALTLFTKEAQPSYIIVPTTHLFNENNQPLLSSSQWWVQLYEKAYLALNIYQGKSLEQQVKQINEEWVVLSVDDVIAEKNQYSSEDQYEILDKNPNVTESYDVLEEELSEENREKLNNQMIIGQWKALNKTVSPQDWGSVANVFNALKPPHKKLEVYMGNLPNLNNLISKNIKQPILVGMSSKNKTKIIQQGLRANHVYMVLGFATNSKDSQQGLLLYDPYGYPDFYTIKQTLADFSEQQQHQYTPDKESPVKFLSMQSVEKLVEMVWIIQPVPDV